MNPKTALVSLALAAVILWRNLPQALLCLWPGLLRTRKLDETDGRVDHTFEAALEEELSPLGFKPLGVREERSPLTRGYPVYDFVNETEQSFASVWRERDENHFALLTPFENGGFVLTTNQKRLGVERPGYLSAGMPDALPEQLLPVHRRRVERVVQEGRKPSADWSSEGRIAAAREWIGRAGVRETRLRYANALILSLMGVVIAISVLQAGIRASTTSGRSAAPGATPQQEAVK